MLKKLALMMLMVVFAGCVNVPEIVIPGTTTTTIPVTTTTTIPATDLFSYLSGNAGFLLDNAATLTTDVLGDNVTHAKRTAIIKRCLANGNDTIYLMLGCADPLMSKHFGTVARGTPYNFFKNGKYGGEVDLEKIAVWQTFMAEAQAAGLTKIFVWCFSDGDAYCKASWADKKTFLDAAVKYFDRYVTAYVTGCEVDEAGALGKAGSKQVAQYLHTITEKPIGVHQLPGKWDYAKDAVYDFFCIQIGFGKSVAYAVDMLKKCMAELKKPVIAWEYSKDSESASAKAQGLAMFNAGAAGTGTGR